jgi:hypothetical protein
MGKHEAGYARVERDFYPTPAWVTEALLDHLNIEGKTIWEPAAGGGDMVQPLRRAGAAFVHATDIEERDYRLHGIRDFTKRQAPDLRLEAIITNPPFGKRGALAEAFIRAGLWHLEWGVRLLALLLPADFDSAASRQRLFGSPYFAAKIVLTRRIVWFERSDGVREAPKENHAWFIWRMPCPHGPPALLYQRPAPWLKKIAASYEAA